jgi:hypothetical protein
MENHAAATRPKRRASRPKVLHRVPDSLEIKRLRHSVRHAGGAARHPAGPALRPSMPPQRYCSTGVRTIFIYHLQQVLF